MHRREILQKGGLATIAIIFANLLPRRAIAMALEDTENFENREKAAAKARIDLAFANPDLKDKISMHYANALIDSPSFDAYVQYIQDRVFVAEAIAQIYGIPSCVAMAQSLNESNAGLSDLAVNHNNYFGLTCKEKHIHAQFGCKFKNDKGIKQYFKSFVGEGSNASWYAYGDRLKNRFWMSKEGGRHMVYGKCFEQTSLWGWCKNLGETYAHSKTYATSLFTLIILFDLQTVLGTSLPLTDNHFHDPLQQQSRDGVSNQSNALTNEQETMQEIIYVQCIEGKTLFSAVQSAYTADVARYNSNFGLRGNNMLTINKLCSYIQKQYFNKPGCGPNGVGKRCLPLDFTVSAIVPGTF